MINPVQSILLLLLRVYKVAISPMLGQNCRFYPSCSEYAAEAIRAHGAVKGCALAGRRLCKCHPWHPGGVDPVPQKTPQVSEKSEKYRFIPTSDGRSAYGRSLLRWPKRSGSSFKSLC
ncbi:membrane protein insertion efficiency factor YidD [Undibacterium sp. Jales W-56]|uniref:membrane protein insertion efficiency factor YidD n=1 Tax=Undibacterium sp. Jales W-56 TaxID=2897325 RepID=UPI0021D349EA|nr:membrane protein insertion efficiency factor YidD [Undibacterium sp. Jales W-56]MCU6434194.1 membrane protein insertion efficiency factor YidD [Undibacterium sp. Jales W-56]